MFRLEVKKGVVTLGIFLAVLEVFYCILFGWIIITISQIIVGQSILAIGVFLLLLVIGAGGSGLIIFGYPAYFAFQGQKEKAITIVISTIITLIIVTILLAVLVAAIALLAG